LTTADLLWLLPHEAREVPALTRRAAKLWLGAKVVRLVEGHWYVLCRPGQEDLRLAPDYVGAQRALTALGCRRVRRSR
jgi:hypothetical protein